MYLLIVNSQKWSDPDGLHIYKQGYAGYGWVCNSAE